MNKVLVIVDVQKEFDKFIQGDLVDSLYEYCENFKEVYQIWDTHKNKISPTYKFPNQIDSIKKMYGKNHFSDKIKEFIKEAEDETFEGNTFKLSNDEGYIVRVDNNHGWFFVNKEIVGLIGKLKDKEVILVGGASEECIEDVYQAFKAFGLNAKINKKYVYSAQTDQNDSIEDTNENYNSRKIKSFQQFLLEGNQNWPYRFKTEEEFIKEFGENWRKCQQIVYPGDAFFSFAPHMDFLLGKDFKSKFPTDEDSMIYNVEYKNQNKTFWISDIFLTKNIIKPNYKPKKFNKNI